MAQPGWVTMTHPDGSGEEAEVTQEAFDEVWAEKGWTIVGEKVAAVQAPKASKKEEAV